MCPPRLARLRYNFGSALNIRMPSEIHLPFQNNEWVRVKVLLIVIFRLHQCR